MHVVSYVPLLVLLCRTWNVKIFFLNLKSRHIVSRFYLLDIDKVPRWDENFVILRSV